MNAEPERLENAPETNDENRNPKRLIGSQRNPEAYRPKPTIEVVGEKPVETPKTESYPPEPSAEKAPEKKVEIPQPTVSPAVADAIADEGDDIPDQLSVDGEKSMRAVPPKSFHKVQVPRFKSDDIDDELDAMFKGQQLDTMIGKSVSVADKAAIEPSTKLKAKILSVRGESVFFDLGVREQGAALLNLFRADFEPVAGMEVDVTVIRFLPEEGLYDVTVPLAAADVRDWSQIQEGMVVEAKVVKTNNGGLECEVNRLRAFMPISQIELFRVDNIDQYVGQKLTCVVEEADPERRNLVLSRRSLLQRERDELREKAWEELEVGQIRDGLIRKIIDAGAFVDLGGVDGFIPISAISWGRIKHPSDVLTEGTRVNVRIAKIDKEANRISLVYRDDASNPWANIDERFQVKTTARGKVSKIMDFGAFVELMPGVEGLIHISELARKRVGSVNEIVKEGEWVDVYILSIDPVTKRIALSMKELAPIPEPEPTPEPAAESEQTGEPAKKGKGKKDVGEPVAAPVKFKQSPKGPLKGGAGQSSGGEQFGLKW